MSLLDQNVAQIKTASGYQFSTRDISEFGATEYTLVGIAVDKSSSVTGFASDLAKALTAAVDACRKSPRAENLTLRVTTFNGQIHEFHGFDFLNAIRPERYSKLFDHIGGTTALVDATTEMLESVETEGKRLTANGVTVNSIVFVITDGQDVGSRHDPGDVGKIVARIQKAEVLENVTTVLVGINDADPALKNYLETFKSAAGLNQYVSVGDATPQRLAKLADFVSKSISSTSQAVGTGGPSQPMIF